MDIITVKTKYREELVDITPEVAKIVRSKNILSGIAVIYTPHTTAAVTINENADPAVRKDIIAGLASLGMDEIKFSHLEGNSPAHIKSSLVGCSETVIIENSSIHLGTWQGIYLCEFDGPRTREVWIKIIK